MVTLCVDGSNMLRRCFAVSETESWKEYAYMFTRTLTVTLEKFTPSQVFVIWDGVNSNLRRREVFPNYKGNRTDPPVDLVAAKAFLFFNLPRFNIKSILIHGYEADDVARLVMPGRSGIHVTEDKDWFLNVNKNWKVYRPIAKIETTYEDLCNELETDAPLTKYLYMKALMGDKSDNVPGIRGIGYVNAKKFSQLLIKNEPLGNSKKAKLILDNLNVVVRNLKIFDTSWILSDEDAKLKFDAQSNIETVMPTIVTWSRYCHALSSDDLLSWWSRWKAIMGENDRCANMLLSA